MSEHGEEEGEDVSLLWRRGSMDSCSIIRMEKDNKYYHLMFHLFSLFLWCLELNEIQQHETVTANNVKWAGLDMK